MIERGGIVARDARHVARLGEEYGPGLEDVRGKERDQASDLAGDRVLGRRRSQSGSAGGKSRTWPRPVTN